MRTRTLLRVAVVLASCAGSLVVARAQQATPVFRGGVTLVTIDVSVLDRDGKPVAGLTAEDFDVKLGGKASPVRTLDYLQVPATGDRTAGAAAPPAPRGRLVITNGAPPRSDSRAFVLLVDDLSMDPQNGKAMFAAVGRFVAALPATDYVGFVTSSQTRVVNPTTDHAAVQAALATVAGEFTDPTHLNSGASVGPDKGGTTVQHVVGITESMAIDRGDDSILRDVIVRECFQGDSSTVDSQGLPKVLADNLCASDVQRIGRRTAALIRQTVARQVQAVLGVINAMRAAPGIKHLMIVSDGLALYQDQTSLTQVARAAAEAGVQVSVMMEEPGIRLSDNTMATEDPTIPTLGASNGGAMAQRRNDNQLFTTGLQTLADVTGGNFYRVIGSPDPSFARVAVASSAVYRLGVEPAGDTKPGQDFALAVTMRRPNLVVHANRHAIVSEPAAATAAGSGGAPAAPLSIDDQLKAAVGTGHVLYGVPVSVATALRKTQNAATIDVGVSLQVPSSVKGPLTTVFGIVDDQGTMRGGRRTLEASPDGSDYFMSFGIPVAAGHWRVRVAVADADGHIGAVEAPVTTEFAKMGPMLVSDLLTLWLDAAGKPQFLSLPDVPPGATLLAPSIELYAAPGSALPADVHVRLALVPEGQSQAVTEIEKDITPTDDHGTLRATLQIPWPPVPAGTYTVRATVTVAGAEVGTVTTTVRKK